MENNNDLGIKFDYSLLDDIKIIEESIDFLPKDDEIIVDKEIEDNSKLNFNFINNDGNTL